ncbi:hypothetical protein PBV87_07460 [Niameybacter massiliensis]|uniref:Uncharacterized protein n=1 Tax=Holtiella tumoricola TaxID=3018743 RepID=A0AA42DLT8_9FIRM|nr:MULTISPECIES: hypothetical protein [Lachnospirales]MDA3731316.1 hypothetical protein [Holtiella tumoricola]
MKSWGLALASLGCISIMVGPALVENYLWMIVQGILLLIIGFVLLKKGKS